jgi:hypothetical protein
MPTERLPHRMGPRLPRVALALLLLCFAISSANATFEEYVPVYNELVHMATSRCDVVGIGWGNLNTRPAGASLSPAHMTDLINVTQRLTSHFIKWPSESLGPFDINAATRLDGFFSLLASDGNAIVLVPGDCTSDGIELTTQNFQSNYNALPILARSLHQSTTR